MTGRTSNNINEDKGNLQEIHLKDDGVFESKYKLYYKKLYMVAYSYTKSQEYSEEIVHDVFLKIWDQEGALLITQSLASYLHRAVVNTSLNIIKREQKQMIKNENFAADFEELYTDENNHSEQLETQLIKLEKALELLPPQCKKVMMMSKFDKRKQQDIADTLNISIKTVKNHLTYGFKKIRLILAEQELTIVLLAFFSLLD